MTLLVREQGRLPLGFGGASISGEGAGYGFGDITEDQAINLLHEAKDLGVRIFDTAPIYGFGTSEQRIGAAFKNTREEVFIISKSGVTWDSNKRVDMSNDPVVTLKMLEQSLRDLNTDYIDLFMIHWPDQKVDIRKPIEVLAKAKAEGKIKHIGLCNTNNEEIEKASEVAPIEAVQNQLNLFERDSLELFSFLKEKEISFMSWGTLDKGILTGRVDRSRKFDKSDCRSWAPWWKEMDKESRFKAMEKINPLLKESGHSGLELALGHNLSFEEVSLVLCGARNSEQLNGLVNALGHLPNNDLLEKAKEIVSSK
ncbi:MAG: aryl-alcohol dehydrogenase-like predicted oxidoreductase [Bacteriovoracaceae bacterium]|jgi:aryl-alcohol dehydrogenase-like predicted oxidoreductase